MTRMRVYAGIGSRATPAEALQIMELAGEALALQGWKLRSGHAPGADQSFEDGAGAKAEAYLPWAGFEKAVPVHAAFIMDRPSEAAFRLAERYHPSWATLTQGARALHARNAHILLGATLRDPAGFVICWTPGGAATGGTGMALRIAEANGVPVFNIWLGAHRERVCRLINRYLEAQ